MVKCTSKSEWSGRNGERSVCLPDELQEEFSSAQQVHILHQFHFICQTGFLNSQAPQMLEHKITWLYCWKYLYYIVWNNNKIIYNSKLDFFFYFLFFIYFFFPLTCVTQSLAASTNHVSLSNWNVSAFCIVCNSCRNSKSLPPQTSTTCFSTCASGSKNRTK